MSKDEFLKQLMDGLELPNIHSVLWALEQSGREAKIEERERCALVAIGCTSLYTDQSSRDVCMKVAENIRNAF